MKPLRIVFVTTSLQTGGAERMLFNILSEIDRQRFAPSIISLRELPQGDTWINELGVPVYSVQMEPSRPTLGALLRLRQFVHDIQPDIVQGWMYHGNIAALGATLPYRNVPVCWSIHHSLYTLQQEKQLTAAIIHLGARVSRMPRRIMYVSHVSRKQHEQIGYHPTYGCVIPNGINLTEFRPLPMARTDIRAELHLPADALLIGLIARFHPYKDHGMFLKGAAQVASHYPEAYIVLAGQGTDQHNPELMQLVTAVGLQERVRLLGERKDISRIIAALDISCSTSIGEALPLSLIEAMACGVPCVVTEVGDSAHLVGDTGIVVQPRDADGLAHALQCLVDAGSPTRVALGQKAQQRIAEQYSLQQVVRAYEETFLSLQSA